MGCADSITADSRSSAIPIVISGIPIDQASHVVATGWGEWHPFHLDGRMAGLIMVYAPRSDADLDVIKDIIEASLANATREPVADRQ